MSKIIISLIGLLFLVGAGCTPSPDKYVAEATTWVETSSSTYLYDGSGLKLKEAVPGNCASCWDIYLDFESSAAGFGDRSDQILAQVITPHTIRLRYLQGELIEAITDEVYDEQHARKLESIFLNEPAN
ncbi:TPA: hypothetical protein DEB00_01775 [Candidatus Uhrbacteria bacterium]|nr:hypothetical protein [Candidatus Uhrbacteria bacterium]